MSGQLTRYQIPEVTDHLASQFVLGTLSPRVRARTQRLRSQVPELDHRIRYWETRLSPLDDETEEVIPKQGTWTAIEDQLFGAPESIAVAQPRISMGWIYKLTSGFSFAVALIVSILWWQQEPPATDNLSYLAVMHDSNQTPQLVATTYGASRTLALEVLSMPQISEDEGLELWVASKTDKQIRSLGVLPRDQMVITKTLSEAQWRLIKDSDYLLLTKEESGGSPIGEPMGEMISKGLCIQLAGWQEGA